MARASSVGMPIATNKGGKKHIPQKEGGQPRPKHHSGTRQPVSYWKEIIAKLEEDVAAAQRRTVTQVGMKREHVDEDGPVVLKRERAAELIVVKRERAEHDELIAAKKEISDLREALHVAQRTDDEKAVELAESRRLCTHANGRADRMSELLQQAHIDLEWAVLCRKDKQPPPTELRRRANAKPAVVPK